jgi:hypothetical protein
MADLNIEEIERDAADRQSLASKTKELQSIVNRLYPGYKVILSKNGAEIHARTRTRDPFARMTQVEQIREVLKDGPMALQSLFTTLHNRGSRVSLQSLMSLLSAGRKADKFRKAGRGIWGLPQHIGTENLEDKK